jgi:Methyltransferase domain
MFHTLFHEKKGIERYKRHLKFRYQTFLYAFEQFVATGGKTVVELGTCRSFVNNGLRGCMVNDVKYWNPAKPRNWDWGAGFFTRMCALHLQNYKPDIHSVDISADAIAISKIITADFAEFITYHHMTSEDFLHVFDGKIDLLYMDAGDTDIKTAELHRREARIVLARQLLSPNAVVLIDDVNVPANAVSKGMYSIPLFCEHGFQIKVSDYQVVLQSCGVGESAASSPSWR